MHMITTLQSLLFVRLNYHVLGRVHSLTISKANYSLQCSALLDDAKRFVLAYRSVIDLAPLQVYSMLAFCTKE